MAVVALVLGLGLIAVGSRTAPPSTVNTRLGDPRNRAEQLIWGMDGKAFFQIGEDPTLAHAADAYGGSAPHGAYRSTRPLLGWLAWGASGGGQRPALGWALLALGVAATGALVLALDAVGHAIGRHPTYPVAAVALPGVLASVVYPGLCEPLAYALALFGLARWLTGDRLVAVVCFSLAAITRETTLLIPAAVAMDHLVRTRRVRGVLPLVVPPAVYAAWVGLVRLRVGALPTGGAQFSPPLTGLATSIPGWGPMEWLTAGVTVAAAAFALRTGPSAIRWIVAAHLVLFACLNPIVADDWWAFGRVTLPIGLLALACLGSPLTAEQPTRDQSPERGRGDGIAPVAPSVGLAG